MPSARFFAAAPVARGTRNRDTAAQRPGLVARELYGFVPADCVGEWNGSASARRIHCIRSGRVAALAGPLSLRLPLRGRVHGALARLRLYQHVLEEVMRRTPVLPARFGARLPGRAATGLLLRDNEDRLLRAIEAYGHLLQFGLRVTGPRVAPGSGPRILAAREHIRLELRSFCLAMRDEPDPQGRALLCMTVLTRPWDEARLDAALARLDGEFGGWLQFTCIGPLPPCSFVRVTLTRNSVASSAWGLDLSSTLSGAAWPPLPLQCPAARPSRRAAGQAA